MNSIGFDAIKLIMKTNSWIMPPKLLLTAIDGVKLYGTAAKKTSVISFNVGNIHPYDIGTLLDKMGIAVRTGHHCAQPIMDYYQIPWYDKGFLYVLQHEERK
jgi:cysteine desulfurase/selenocysteine lyase